MVKFPGLFFAGDEVLRSKSLDRDSRWVWMAGCSIQRRNIS
jgi:hypothetical protein